MEIVSNVTFLYREHIPGERFLRVCLIFLLSGMLYLSVQNHAESMEEEMRGNIVEPADIRSENGFHKMDPVGISKEVKIVTGIMTGERAGNFKFLTMPFVKSDAGCDTVVKRTEMLENPAVTEIDDPIKNSMPEVSNPEITVTPVITIPDIGEIKITVDVPEESETEVIESVTGETGITENLPEENEISVIKPITKKPEMTTEESGIEKDKVITTVTGETDSAETGSEDNAAETETETADETDVHEATILSGFVMDAEGYITGTESTVDVTDGILVIPIDPSCVGIRKVALSNLSESVYELYIPENIRDIEPGALAELISLLYIEVAEDNPYYYSMDGVLYSAAGEEIFDPCGECN